MCYFDHIFEGESFAYGLLIAVVNQFWYALLFKNLGSDETSPF